MKLNEIAIKQSTFHLTQLLAKIGLVDNKFQVKELTTDFMLLSYRVNNRLNGKVTYSKSTQGVLRRKQHRQLLNSKKAIFDIKHLPDILFR